MVSSRKPSLQTSKPRCSPVSGLIFVRDSPTANLPAAIRDQPCPLPQGGDPTGPRRLAASPVRAISSLIIPGQCDQLRPKIVPISE